MLMKVSPSNEMDEIRIGAIHFPPNSLITKDLNTSRIISATGKYHNMFDFVAKHSKLKLVMIAVNDTDIEESGPYTASFHQLLNGEVDICALGGVASPDALEVEDFSVPFTLGLYRFLTPLPGDESRVWAVIKPFQPMVWLTLLITWILVVFILYLLSSYNDGERNGTKWLKNNKLTLLAENFTFATSTLTNQGSSISAANNRDSFRILAGAWFLVGLILVNSYAGLLIPSLTVRKMNPVINSFEDLLNEKKSNGLTLAVNEETRLAEDILNAESGILKMVGDHLRLYPHGLFRSRAAFNARVASMRYAVLDTFPATNNYMSMDFKLHNQSCRYWGSRPVSYSTYVVLGLRKNGRHNNKINKAVQNMVEIGLYDHWSQQDKNELRYDKCEAKNILEPSTRPDTPIMLWDLISPFIILGIGILLSGFVFIIEFAMY